MKYWVGLEQDSYPRNLSLHENVRNITQNLFHSSFPDIELKKAYV